VVAGFAGDYTVACYAGRSTIGIKWTGDTRCATCSLAVIARAGAATRVVAGRAGKPAFAGFAGGPRGAVWNRTHGAGGTAARDIVVRKAEAIARMCSCRADPGTASALIDASTIAQDLFGWTLSATQDSVARCLSVQWNCTCGAGNPTVAGLVVRYALSAAQVLPRFTGRCNRSSTGIANIISRATFPAAGGSTHAACCGRVSRTAIRRSTSTSTVRAITAGRARPARTARVTLSNAFASRIRGLFFDALVARRTIGVRSADHLDNLVIRVLETAPKPGRGKRQRENNPPPRMNGRRRHQKAPRKDAPASPGPKARRETLLA
jgi:hypothetical protein